MNRLSATSAFFLLSAGIASASLAPACSGSSPGGTFNSGSGSGSGGSSGGTPIILPGGSSGSGGGASSGGTVACPSGLQCDVSCSGGGSTTVTGKVYDPAKKNPLYNVAVYVPATALTALPKGVPTGAAACSCDALFSSGSVVSTTTDVDGSFTLTNVPVGTSVPLVLQVGKWRKEVNIAVTACTANAQPDKSLALPATVAAGSNDNIPDIAVSTGNADTLECLMTRIGLATTEYVAGAAGTGHIHVFSGGDTGGKGAAARDRPRNPRCRTRLRATRTCGRPRPTSCRMTLSSSRAKAARPTTRIPPRSRPI